MRVPALPEGYIVLYGVVDAFLQRPFLSLGTGGQRDDRQGCDNDDNVLFHIH